MIEVVETNQVHHGKNIKFAREFIAGLNQEDLAIKLNMSSSKLSRIESQEIVDDEILNTIALALDVPLDFLKKFAPELATMSYTVNAETVTFTDKAQSATQIDNDTHNYYPADMIVEFKSLYDRVLERQDQEIKSLQIERNTLVDKNIDLEKKLSKLEYQLELKSTK